MKFRISLQFLGQFIGWFLILGVAENKKNLWFGIFDTLNFEGNIFWQNLEYQKCKITSMENDFLNIAKFQNIFYEIWLCPKSHFLSLDKLIYILVFFLWKKVIGYTWIWTCNLWLHKPTPYPLLRKAHCTNMSKSIIFILSAHFFTMQIFNFLATNWTI